MLVESEVYVELEKIFSEVFLREGIVLRPETTAANVNGWDSFKQIEIIMLLEEFYGIKFRTRDLDDMEKVDDIVQAVLRKVNT